MGGTAGYARPVDPTGLSTWTAHTNRGTPSTEPGTDYYCPVGTPIRAAAGGRVVDVGNSIQPATGRYVTIDLDDGRRVRYLHILRRHVNVGDYVQWGQHIADSGATGYGEEDWSWNVAETGGAHVHMTLWARQAYTFGRYATLDPELYMAEDGTDMNAEEWRQFQVLAANVNAIASAVANINAWISEGGPGVDAGLAKPGTVASRVINLDRQVTGADNFGATVGPTVAERLIDVQKNTQPGTGENT